MSSEPILQPLEAPEHATHNPQPGPSLRSPISGMATAAGDQATASTSASAPEIHTERSLSASPIAVSPSYNPASSTSSLSAKQESSSSSFSNVLGAMEPSATAGALGDAEPPDPQILEALRNKDRIYVLKLGEQMETLIRERGARIELSPTTSYQRLLVYRCSTYYKLAPEKDQGGKKTITVYCRSESRIPARRLSELVPVEESAQPAFQIMRRVDRNPRGRQHSHPSSTAGDDADTSDVDASEAGSVGGVSSAASASARRYKTIQEREAEYKEARSRIFMGFEEKKEKEKDMSANSSTFSLVSGSGSTSGGRGSSIGDLDDSASSAPTESEWSGPVTRDKRDGWRGPSSTNSSVRSLRSSGASFNTNGSGSSSRNSRATSPSFQYPSLHDPASAPQFEQGQYGNTQPPPPPPSGYVTHYPYPPYQQPPLGQQYTTPYYYPPYHYPPPAAHSDPTTPGGPEVMYMPPPNPPQQQPSYGSPYIWSNVSSPGPQPLPPHLQPQPQPQHPPQPGMPPAHLDGHSPGHPMSPPMQNPAQYPSYAPAPSPYGYGMPGYFPQPSYQPSVPMGPPPPPVPSQIYHPGPIPDPMGAHMNAGNGIDGPNISRTSSRNSTGHSSVNGKRGGGPRPRGPWTYGPGSNSPGFNYNLTLAPNGMSANDAYGPRLSTNMRRQSNTSSSGSAGTRTPADETSSTASSSTTSSSSRRTFTSTSTSSKHPLPARPDWAVGLKPQHPRHHDHHSNAASRTMSPARMSGGPAHLPPQQHQSQPVLQPNDFPPLSSGPSTRQPVVGGAWTNNASMSRVMMPGPQGNTNTQSSVLVQYPNSQTSSPQAVPAPAPAALRRLDEQDLAFERPPPKNAELFNPKAAGRVGGNGGRVENGRSRADTGASAAAGIADRLSSMVLADAEAIGRDLSPPGYGPSAGEPVVAIVAGEAAMASS